MRTPDKHIWNGSGDLNLSRHSWKFRIKLSDDHGNAEFVGAREEADALRKWLTEFIDAVDNAE